MKQKIQIPFFRTTTLKKFIKLATLFCTCRIEVMSSKESSTKEEIEQLERIRFETPYAYQVAGHGALLKLPDNRICKPFIEIEHSFYESMQRECKLSSFIASYYGTIDFNFSQKQLEEWNHMVNKTETEQKSEDKKQSFGISDNHLNPWSAKVTKLILSKIQKNGNPNLHILSKRTKNLTI